MIKLIEQIGELNKFNGTEILSFLSMMFAALEKRYNLKSKQKDSKDLEY